MGDGGKDERDCPSYHNHHNNLILAAAKLGQHTMDHVIRPLYQRTLKGPWLARDPTDWSQPTTPIHWIPIPSSTSLLPLGHHPLPSFPWITYRYGFPPIATGNPSSSTPPITSDAGWGCMIRVGQMILATALYRHHLDIPHTSNQESKNHPQSYRDTTPHSDLPNLLSWFLDSHSAPYSIHRITAIGSSLLHIPAGSWYGPSSISQVLHVLVHEAQPSTSALWHPTCKPLSVVVGSDGTIYIDSITLYGLRKPRLPFPDELDENQVSVLLLIPQRIGLHESNPIYFDAILATLDCKYSVGIGGGKPNSSLFFIGYEQPSLLAREARLVYLDPHYCRPCIPPQRQQLIQEEVASFSCQREIPHSLPIDEIDPSLVLGFYFADRAAFDDFLTWSIPWTSGTTPLFGVERCAADCQMRAEQELDDFYMPDDDI